MDALANQGYDPTFGARPLKRVIQQQIQNPLATEILKGEFTEGTRSASTSAARNSSSRNRRRSRRPKRSQKKSAAAPASE